MNVYMYDKFGKPLSNKTKQIKKRGIEVWERKDPL